VTIQRGKTTKIYTLQAKDQEDRDNWMKLFATQIQASVRYTPKENSAHVLPKKAI